MPLLVSLIVFPLVALIRFQGAHRFVQLCD